MVMESPSPECVGREFVRQYYTLMNEAPDFLHRFYSGNSSFIHSGVDRPGQEAEAVHGQKDIHKKIQELNFKDCHTKIRQVDSQATIGDGVVVQVTGELSNHGGPMRRFMQTFVLAHQTPKQYYVNNDIFRYQDEVFQDSYESEEEAENHGTSADLAAQDNGIAADPVANGLERSDRPVSPGPQSVLPERTPGSPQPTFMETPAVVPEEPAVSSLPDKLDLSSPEPLPLEPEVPYKVEESRTEVEAPVSSANSQPLAEKPTKFSWANVAAGSSTPLAVVPPMSSVGNVKQAALPLATIAAQQKEDEENMVTSQFPVEDHGVHQQPVKAVSRASAESSKPPRNEDRDRRTNERFPDTHQVFVGNLPQDIADLELKRFFNKYGKVLDVRVNRSGAAGKVPFGFVVFENEEPVNTLLALKRVEMEGHRLNVEEKKARNDRAGSNSRSGKGQRPSQRGGSRPKDRENSGSRSDNRQAQGRKYPRP